MTIGLPPIGVIGASISKIHANKIKPSIQLLTFLALLSLTLFRYKPHKLSQLQKTSNCAADIKNGVFENFFGV